MNVSIHSGVETLTELFDEVKHKQLKTVVLDDNMKELFYLHVCSLSILITHCRIFCLYFYIFWKAFESTSIFQQQPYTLYVFNASSLNYFFPYANYKLLFCLVCLSICKINC